MIRLVSSGWLLVLVLVVGCGGAQRPAPESRGTLRFKGEPGDARLAINETHLGPIQMFENKGVLLRPGPARVTVSRPGYFTEYRLVEVEANSVTTVEISLRETP